MELAPSRTIARVELHEVTRLFGPTPVLRGVTATFRSGTTTVLFGGNGAGKSTLLSVIGTRLRPTRGIVEYFDSAGRELAKEDVRSELGWVSHETMAYRELTGFENVRLVAELAGLGSEAVEAIAERTRLGKFANRPVGTLSRGQKQRVALARALVHAPSLLLLDEPWTGLDSEASKDLERLIAEEQARGAVIVLVSHDPGLAERIGATPVWLLRGKLSTLPPSEEAARGRD